MKLGAVLSRIVLACLISAGTPAALADPSDVSEAMAGDPDVIAAREAYDKKNWNEAIARFHKAEVRFPDSADLHNSLGHAYRSLKQLEPAFQHYRKALELEPRHRGAHEYIGEAYLMAGDLASAEKHLAALREICLLPCEEFKDLEKEIAAYRTTKAAGAR